MPDRPPVKWTIRVVVIWMEGIITKAAVNVRGTVIYSDIVPSNNRISVIDHIVTAVNINVNVTGIDLYITAAFVNVSAVAGFIIPVV